MTDRFPRAKKGYLVSQVEEFLAHAKEQYLNPEVSEMDVKTIRAMRFDLARDGYSISAVDAAMEKLEDVFASRELAKLRNLIGPEAFSLETAEVENLIAARATRKKGKHFKRRVWPNRGYSVKQVDLLCSQVAAHLAKSETLSLRDVRIAVFKSRRGGYAEHQVDAFMDKVVELLQRQEISNS